MAQTAAERMQTMRGRMRERRELAQEINELVQRAFIGSSTVDPTGDVDDRGRPIWRVATDWDAEVLEQLHRKCEGADLDFDAIRQESMQLILWQYWYEKGHQ